MSEQSKTIESVADRLGNLIHLSIVFIAVALFMAAANAVAQLSHPMAPAFACCLRIIGIMYLGLESWAHIDKYISHARPPRTLVYGYMQAEGWCIAAGFLVVTLASPSVLGPASIESTTSQIVEFIAVGLSIALIVASFIALGCDVLRILRGRTSG